MNVVTIDQYEIECVWFYEVKPNIYSFIPESLQLIKL